MRYLPKKQDELLRWAQNFSKLLSENCAQLKLDSKKVSEIVALVTNFKAALDKSREYDRTKSDITRKNAVLNQLREKIKCFTALYLDYNPAMTSDHRIAMGLKPLIPVRSKSMAPSGRPRLTAKTGGQRIIVSYTDEDSGGKARPKGVRGIVYRWAFADEEFKLVQKASGPLVLPFREEDLGRAVMVSARWDGRLGDQGPWSNTMKVFVA